MWEYTLWSLALLTGLGSLVVPQTLSQTFQQAKYIIPTYSEENELTLVAAPDVHLPLRDVTVQARGKALPAIEVKKVPQLNTTTTPEDWGPELAAKAGIIIDAGTGKILWQKDADTARPIASISKLLTAVVVARQTTNWNIEHTMTSGEVSLTGASFPARAGDVFSRLDLLKTAMVASANGSAQALANSTGLTDDEFAADMMGVAKQIGMEHVQFVEPTGLSAKNQASAKDVAVLLREALRTPEIVEALQLSEHNMKPRNDEGREITVRNTNKLIRNDANYIVGGKTGFTYEAGYCLVALSQHPDGQQVITVVLGADSEDQRFAETQELVDWAFENYDWR